MKHLKKLEDEVSTWPHISVHPHRFGGKEFRFGSAEVGHIHAGGIVDIPFPRSVRDALLAGCLAGNPAVLLRSRQHVCARLLHFRNGIPCLRIGAVESICLATWQPRLRASLGASYRSNSNLIAFSMPERDRSIQLGGTRRTVHTRSITTTVLRWRLMRLISACLGTVILLLTSFSSDDTQMRMRDARQTNVARPQARGIFGAAPDVYAPDPDHIWNRLFRWFYVRHAQNGRWYGGDELDPYLWPETKYLLSGSSRDEALKLLDEFLQQHSERLIADPLKRAVFQRDLLAVYDWLSLASDEQAASRSALQKSGRRSHP